MARLRSRSPSDKESFNKRLQLYSLAASAAGVSLLALGQPAEAKVVYTKADTPISPNSTVLLDLNNDGVADFKLTDTFHGSTTGGGGAFGSLFVAPAQQNNQVLGHTVPFRAYASALFANVEVGPKQEFLPNAGAGCPTGRWFSTAREISMAPGAKAIPALMIVAASSNLNRRAAAIGRRARFTTSKAAVTEASRWEE